VKCPKCQFENRNGVKFCEQCGAKMELECPNCGAKIPLDSKFCGECGHDLVVPKEVPPIDYNQPQSYTPKFLADKILTTRSSIEGERKLVTVLFADIANYTSIAEKLDPEVVHDIMDGCFRILIDEIHEYEGTINQFTGDGVMALFGAPVAHEDHAQRACYAALSIQSAMAEYSEKIMKETHRERDSFGRPHNPYSALCSYYALSLEMMGNFDEGHKYYEKGHSLARDMQDLHSLSLLELNHGLLHNVRGEGVAAIEHLRNCIEYCEQGQILIYLGLAWMGLGWGHYFLGELETAQTYVEKGLKIQRDAGIPYREQATLTREQVEPFIDWARRFINATRKYLEDHGDI
jgi:tetratricopeptide (TPR) repeat protein